jgi:teichuronic acid biosynthesis glycosyltransferase TuaG
MKKVSTQGSEATTDVVPPDSNLVSIITPAFRCANVVGDTIRSVIAQTHADWEMLIAEDCSPDNTREVIRDWTRNEPRVKLIEMPANGGPAAARNAALERASGRWLAFLDSDDLWLPQKLERSLAFARDHEAAFVFTGFRRIDAAGSLEGRYLAPPRTLSYTQLLGNTAIATSTVLLDRHKVGTVRMTKTYYDDFDCWLKLLKPGRLAHGLDEDLMRYRILGQSVSRNKRNSAVKVWRAYRDLEKLGLIASSWYFTQYAVRGLLKYRRY